MLLYPNQFASLKVQVPPSFWAGAVELTVTAADGAVYRPATDGSMIPGNVSTPTVRQIPVRRQDQLRSPVSKPHGIRWARAAGLFEDEALYLLTWDAIPDAVRYEVDRVTEGHFGYPPNMVSDDKLLELSGTKVELFERRSNYVFAPRFTDSLPGRAPTRALYRVRAISIAEVPGSWSRPIGPVRVPDVRIPPRPNFLRATATSGVLGEGRCVRLEWTQVGPLDRIGFIIESRDASSSQEWEVASEYLPGMLHAENDAKFVADLVNQVPGKFIRIRIAAVRHALDPVDPWGNLRTHILSERSNEITICATGELRPPRKFSVRKVGKRLVELSWKNDDAYDWIEIRRVGPNSFSRLKCLGTEERFIDAVEDADDLETWKYQLRAIGYGRNARTDEKQIVF